MQKNEEILDYEPIELDYEPVVLDYEPIELDYDFSIGDYDFEFLKMPKMVKEKVKT